MKKLVASIASVVLALSLASPASASDRFDLDTIPIAGGSTMMQIVESDVLENSSSINSSPKSTSTREERDKGFKTCSTIDDPNCDVKDPSRNFGANIVFPNCSVTQSPFCLEGLEISLDGASFQQAEFLRMANNGSKVVSNSKYGLLEGGSPSIFELKNSSTGEITTYVATVKVLQQFDSRQKKFTMPYLSASVLPVRVDVNSKYQREGDGSTNGCVYFEVGSCGIAQDFSDNVKIKLNFKAPSAIGGWFRGRIKNPTISVDKADASANRFSIEAEPATIPKFGIERKINSLTAQEKIWFDTYAKWGTKAGLASGVDASFPESFKMVDYFRDQAQDKVSGSSKTWFVTTVFAGNGNRCLSDTSKVQGIVTTNSLVYDGGAPSFKNGFLDYKVAGLHYLPDGKTKVQGTYDLVMRSETARCLYGFSNAPLSATISVTGGSDKTVATTVVSEKNGWLKMAAYGFTFSNKTIKVKITKKAVVKKPAVKKAPTKR